MRLLSGLLLCLAFSMAAMGAGSGPAMPSGSPSSADRQPPSPEEQARTAYNDGVRAVEKADALQAEAARQSNVARAEKLRAKAAKAYGSALQKFVRATELQPGLYQAWNYRGYCQRKLGQYDAALAAYERALTLKPDYAEAIEYRGHAYLGLNRLTDAQNAYLILFASHRPLADQLLSAMQQWAEAHPDQREFAAWVQERLTIAAQTASLTPAGSSAAASRWQ